MLPKESPAISINTPGLGGEEEELLCLRFKSCSVCAVPRVADVLFLVG